MSKNEDLWDDDHRVTLPGGGGVDLVVELKNHLLKEHREELIEENNRFCEDNRRAIVKLRAEIDQISSEIYIRLERLTTWNAAHRQVLEEIDHGNR